MYNNMYLHQRISDTWAVFFRYGLCVCVVYGLIAPVRLKRGGKELRENSLMELLDLEREISVFFTKNNQ